MNTKEYRKNGVAVVEIIEDGVLIDCVQDYLDIITDVCTKKIIIKKENISEDFFDLHTGFAGEILQKASNYRLSLGILGDFSNLESKALRDFIYESNENRQIVFKQTAAEIVKIFCVRKD